MQFFLILALIIIALAVVFALQNPMVVTVAFLVWKHDYPLAVVLIVALCVGALISLLFSLPSLVRDKWTIRTHKKKLTDMETSLADHKTRLEEAHQRLQEKEAPPAVVPPLEPPRGPVI